MTPPSESVEREPSERSIPLDRPPINPDLPHHEFVESEFEEGAGRCDRCGGGPLAQIHQKPVDQMARIADALERIAEALEQIQALGWAMTDSGDDGATVNVRPRA